MKKLAEGASNDPIFKLIKVLLDTQQKDMAQAVLGDTSALADISDEIKTSKKLYSEE